MEEANNESGLYIQNAHMDLQNLMKKIKKERSEIVI